MKYRLIALDLDDTLLREDLTISERTCSALLSAQAQGVTIALVSGRPTGSILKYAQQLRMDEFGGYIISFNGAMATECTTGNIFFERCLTRDNIHLLYDLSVAYGVYIHSYLDDNIITAKSNPYTAIECKLTGMNIIETDDFKSSMNRDAIKVILLETPEILKDLSVKLAPVINGRMNMSITKPYFLEFMDNGIDKGHGLRLLLEWLKISSEETIAIGDSYNDIEMLRLAGLGICMANGPDEVRAVADHITASNMEDGVAKVVEQCILKVGN